MIIKKKFSELVDTERRSQKVSYEELSKRTGISKTYLTDILKKDKIPSKDVVEKIADALNIDKQNIREYRVMDILDKIRYSYQFYGEEEIKKIEKVISTNIPKVPTQASILTGNISSLPEEINYLDLSLLSEQAKKIVIDSYNSVKNIFEPK